MWGKSSVSVFLLFSKSSLFVRMITDHIMQIVTGVVSYKLTYVAYKSHRQKSRNTAIILIAGFFFLASVTVAHYKFHLQQFVFLFTYAECSFF